MKKKQKVVLISGVILLLVIIMGIVFCQDKQTEEIPDVEQEEEAGFETITYKGERYKYNTDLKTILFMGVDKTEKVKEQEYAGRGGQSDVLMLFVLDTNKQQTQILQISRDSMAMGVDKTEKVKEQEYAGRGGQSDVLMLFVLDTNKQQTQILQISRDSMAQVDVYDMDGEYLTTDTMQIATQYAYGDGAKKSCLLTKETVSELLYGIPIQSYISLNIDGIAVISETMGGIRITVPEDYTWIDPSFEKGAEVVLKGAQAEAYVRSRDTSVTGSNNNRMERQNQVVEAVAVQLPERAKEDPNLYMKLFSSAEQYMVSDLSTSELEKLSTYESYLEIEQVPGEVKAGDLHDEFYVNDEELYDLLIKLFYKKI